MKMLAGVNTEDQIIQKVSKFSCSGKNGNKFYIRQAIMIFLRVNFATLN
jgi:hypothetical protein